MAVSRQSSPVTICPSKNKGRWRSNSKHFVSQFSREELYKLSLEIFGIWATIAPWNWPSYWKRSAGCAEVKMDLPHPPPIWHGWKTSRIKLISWANTIYEIYKCIFTSGLFLLQAIVDQKSKTFTAALNGIMYADLLSGCIWSNMKWSHSAQKGAEKVTNFNTSPWLPGRAFVGRVDEPKKSSRIIGVDFGCWGDTFPEEFAPKEAGFVRHARYESSRIEAA